MPENIEGLERRRPADMPRHYAVKPPQQTDDPPDNPKTYGTPHGVDLWRSPSWSADAGMGGQQAEAGLKVRAQPGWQSEKAPTHWVSETYSNQDPVRSEGSTRHTPGGEPYTKEGLSFSEPVESGDSAYGLLRRADPRRGPRDQAFAGQDDPGRALDATQGAGPGEARSGVASPGTAGRGKVWEEHRVNRRSGKFAAQRQLPPARDRHAHKWRDLARTREGDDAEFKESEHKRGKGGRFARVDGGSIHPEVQAEHQRVAAMLAKEFPEVAKGTKWAYERRNNATFDPWDKEIKLPVANKEQPLATVNSNEDANNPPGYTVAGGLAATLIHEFGHAINHHIIRGLDDDGKQEWADKKNQIAQLLGAVSEYAKKNTSEGLSERLTAEMLGKAERALIPLLHDYLGRVTKPRVTKGAKDWTRPQWSDNRLKIETDQMTTAPSSGPPPGLRRRALDTAARIMGSDGTMWTSPSWAADAEWKESEHDRDAGGKFTSGGGAAPRAVKDMPKPSEQESARRKDMLQKGNVVEVTQHARLYSSGGYTDPDPKHGYPEEKHLMRVTRVSNTKEGIKVHFRREQDDVQGGGLKGSGYAIVNPHTAAHVSFRQMDDDGDERASGPETPPAREPASIPEEGPIEGLPEGSLVERGNRQLTQGQFRVAHPDGSTESGVWSGWKASREEAIREARMNYRNRQLHREEQAKRKQGVERIASTAREGGEISDNDLRLLDLKPRARFDYISPVIQEMFGISKARVREAMGDAVKKATTDMGRTIYYADSKKAIANAAKFVPAPKRRPKAGD
ncbi:MAG: hypothetical protein FWD12_08505, partial [Alphaproteobacteria bacterium]|nr:hypothetical protein [Alphaproteobacteria bacterium]